jgi:hypothetical protein
MPYSEEYLNYKFNGYVALETANILLEDFQDWQQRVRHYMESEKQRFNNMTIAQRVHERRSRISK